MSCAGENHLAGRMQRNRVESLSTVKDAFPLLASGCLFVMGKIAFAENDVARASSSKFCYQGFLRRVDWVIWEWGQMRLETM